MAKKETMGNMNTMKDSSMSNTGSMSSNMNNKPMAGKPAAGSSEMCQHCNSSPCKCHGPGCRIIGGIIVAILGLLMIWPMGWFTFNKSLGILVLFFGIKILACCRSGRCH